MTSLVIAEQFGTLARLFPGRIELGLGRVPGTDQNTLRALRRSPRRALSAGCSQAAGVSRPGGAGSAHSSGACGRNIDAAMDSWLKHVRRHARRRDWFSHASPAPSHCAAVWNVEIVRRVRRNPSASPPPLVTFGLADLGADIIGNGLQRDAPKSLRAVVCLVRSSKSSDKSGAAPPSGPPLPPAVATSFHQPLRDISTSDLLGLGGCKERRQCCPVRTREKPPAVQEWRDTCRSEVSRSSAVAPSEKIVEIAAKDAGARPLISFADQALDTMRVSPDDLHPLRITCASWAITISERTNSFWRVQRALTLVDALKAVSQNVARRCQQHV